VSGEVALRARKLSKKYRRNWALRNCDIDVPAGGVIALVGPNGAGKTTLLRIAVGLLTQTSGTIEVAGVAPTTSTALPKIGFLAQETPLFPRFTVAELLRFGRSCNVRFDEAFARRRLADLGVALDRRAGTLSGGQRAQVALALALAKRPELLILDEPMAALDPLARREFLQMLMGAVAEGDVTALFSSHVVHELERVCDHLVVINHGQVMLTGDIDDLRTEHRLLVGPRTAVDPDRSGTVVECTHSDRHTTLLVRDGGLDTAPGWQAQPVGLEELILAYLRRPAGTDARHAPEEVPA
jgi:ABC-2 type transport system ATP-binding protein